MRTAIHRRDRREPLIHNRCAPRQSPGTIWHYAQVSARFLTLADVAEVLNVSASQAYALVRSGELPAIKVGGRGQWRVEATALEEYISRMYEQTRTFIETNPVEADQAVTES